jgi:hypothetical protein
MVTENVKALAGVQADDAVALAHGESIAQANDAAAPAQGESTVQADDASAPAQGDSIKTATKLSMVPIKRRAHANHRRQRK